MWKQLIYHDKRHNKLFDYYGEDDYGEDDYGVTYILKVDWVTIYKGNLPLTDTDIERFISKYWF